MSLNRRLRHALPWLLLALAVVVTAAVYWPGVTGGWVFDDYPNIVDNTAIHILPGHATLAAWVNAALSSPSSFLHRPLASITFALNWMAGGGNPWPFKVTNIAIHLVNGVLVFCMLRALLRLIARRGAAVEPLSPRERGRGEGADSRTLATRGAAPSPGAARHPLPGGEGSTTNAEPSLAPAGHPLPGGEGTSKFIDDAAATRLALIVSAAWLLLPINLMAVLYVVQRMESLCQIFVLAGLWAYLHGRWMMLTATDARRDRRGFTLVIAGIVLGTLIGLTSKETAVLLPVFAFLAEWIVIGFGRKRAWLPSPSGRGVGGEGADTRTPATRGAEPSSAPAGHLLPEGEGIPTTAEPSRAPVGQRLPQGSGKADKRIWALFTVTLFAPAVLGTAWLLRSALNPASWSGRDFTLGQRLLTEARVLVDYLDWTLLPNPEVLSLYHDEIVKSTSLLAPWTTLPSIVVLIALIVLAIWLRKRRPLVSLGIGWFFTAQLLTATIVPLELVYEQRMYFASIGVLLAAGALLLGRRRKIHWGLLRGFLVAAALVWFAAATNLRAQEWSNPLRLAVAEANRHPESPRAVYEAGRLLLIASNYQPGTQLDQSKKYLRETAAIPGSSALADQALIMIVDHLAHGDDAEYWQSMTAKLRGQPTRQEDISALVSLTNCYGAGICKFNPADLQNAYLAALSRSHPTARLLGAYADFQRDILHNDTIAIEYLARAVKGDPSEPAYRIDLAALYARNGQADKALTQIDALQRMNLAGRLDSQIATLKRLVEQDKNTP